MDACKWGVEAQCFGPEGNLDLMCSLCMRERIAFLVLQVKETEHQRDRALDDVDQRDGTIRLLEMRATTAELQIEEMRKAMESDRGHTESCSCIRNMFAVKRVQEIPVPTDRPYCGVWVGGLGPCVAEVPCKVHARSTEKKEGV